MRGLSSSGFNMKLHRIENNQDENEEHRRKYSDNVRSKYKDERDLLVFDKPIVESKVMLR